MQEGGWGKEKEKRDGLADGSPFLPSLDDKTGGRGGGRVNIVGLWRSVGHWGGRPYRPQTTTNATTKGGGKERKKD